MAFAIEYDAFSRRADELGVPFAIGGRAFADPTFPPLRCSLRGSRLNDLLAFARTLHPLPPRPPRGRRKRR